MSARRRLAADGREEFRTSEGERLRFERASVPTGEQAAILASLGWPIPEAYLPPNLDTDPARL